MERVGNKDSGREAVPGPADALFFVFIRRGTTPRRRMSLLEILGDHMHALHAPC